MPACFQAYRSDSVASDLFSNMLNDGAVSAAHSFKTRGGRESGPGDSNAFRFFGVCEISISLQTMVDNSKSTPLLNTGKLVNESDVNNEEKCEPCFRQC